MYIRIQASFKIVIEIKFNIRNILQDNDGFSSFSQTNVKKQQTMKMRCPVPLIDRDGVAHV